MDLPSRAAALFAARFGHAPSLGARAPGRVNLIGEHTDYNEGFVLPIAIDRETIIVAAPARDSSSSTFDAIDLGRLFEIDLTRRIDPLPRDHPAFFANYILGVARQFADRGAALPNLDVLITSSIPLGAGLSSSASVEVAMATLLEKVTGIALDQLEKALLCQRAEHAFPGTPCGLMDMYASIFGRAGCAILLDCRSNTSAPVPLPWETGERDLSLLVIDTGVKHLLAGGEYAERRAACERAAAALRLRSLRDATLAMIERGDLGEIEQRRAAHVVSENARVALAAAALMSGQIAEFAARLFESHRSLRDLYAVSCPELDCVVDAAAEFASASGERRIGARMTGGGFGGCAIVLCPAALASDVSRFIQARFAVRFDREPSAFPVRAAAGASAIEPSSLRQ